jgi:hypothetical protein
VITFQVSYTLVRYPVYYGGVEKHPVLVCESKPAKPAGRKVGGKKKR